MTGDSAWRRRLDPGGDREVAYPGAQALQGACHLLRRCRCRSGHGHPDHPQCQGAAARSSAMPGKDCWSTARSPSNFCRGGTGSEKRGGAHPGRHSSRLICDEMIEPPRKATGVQFRPGPGGQGGQWDGRGHGLSTVMDPNTPRLSLPAPDEHSQRLSARGRRLGGYG